MNIFVLFTLFAIPFSWYKLNKQYNLENYIRLYFSKFHDCNIKEHFLYETKHNTNYQKKFYNQIKSKYHEFMKNWYEKES